MTDIERSRIALNLFESKILQDSLTEGYYRWQDEKKYEDIKDYSVLFLKLIESANCKFIEMTKRPFGFKVRIENAIYHYFINASSIGYKGIREKN